MSKATKLIWNRNPSVRQDKEFSIQEEISGGDQHLESCIGTGTGFSFENNRDITRVEGSILLKGSYRISVLMNDGGKKTFRKQGVTSAPFI